MSQILNVESLRKAPPKPPRLSKNIEAYSQLRAINEARNSAEKLSNLSDLNYNEIAEKSDRLCEVIDAIKENGVANEATVTADNSKIYTAEENTRIDNDETLTNSSLVMSEENSPEKPDNTKFFAQRSISTPEERVCRTIELSERPRTYNTSTNKITTDSAKPRVKRKESFLKNVVNVFKKKQDTVRNERKHTTVIVDKPSLFSGNVEPFKDALFRMVDGDFRLRWCFLSIDFLFVYLDADFKDYEECLSLDSVISVQLIEDHKYNFKVDGSSLFYFEIRAETGRYIFGSKSEEERKSWTTKLAKSLNCKLISEEINYQRIGWLYVKEGINGTWIGAWSLFHDRTLLYTINNDDIQRLDLRKARCINLQEAADGDCMPKVFEEGPYMLIDCQKACFYFQSVNLYETEAWYNTIRKGNKNGSRLEEQQLYSYDVPVIIEKCINFIYLHGCLLIGIYRKNGNLSKGEDIVSQFRADAWSTQLPPDIYSGYDVARAFKKFFSELPEPIIAKNSQEDLHQAFSNENEDERASIYRKIFEKYPPVNYKTLRMLLRHLHFIVEYKDKNLMTSENVASIWAVTMMHSEVNDDAHFITRDTELVTDLINLSRKIFPESEKERHQEALVRKTWEDYVTNTKRPINGNFRIWIYYCSKLGDSYNVEIGLHKTAQEVCQELSTNVKIPENKLILEEVILNDQLTRPIHYEEKVLDVVLKWAYWEDADRKDNCLIVSPLEKYEAYLVDNMLPAMDELKFADRIAKNFQNFTFEISCGYLNCFKDFNKSQLVRTWNINEVEWYIGHEKNRNTPTKYTITFVEKNEQKRQQTTHWFGNVLSFSSEFTKNAWVSSLWKEGHKKEFLPLAMEFLMRRCQDNQK